MQVRLQLLPLACDRKPDRMLAASLNHIADTGAKRQHLLAVS